MPDIGRFLLFGMSAFMTLADSPTTTLLAPKPPSDTWSPLLSALRGNDNPIHGMWDFDLIVDDKGRPYQCSLKTTVEKHLDDQTCAILLQGRFVPARDRQGNSVYSVYSSAILWARHGHPEDVLVRRPDVELSVNRMPASLKSGNLRVLRLQNADGSMEACSVEQTSGSDSVEQLACSAVASAPPLLVRDRSGQPIRALRTMRIVFSASK